MTLRNILPGAGRFAGVNVTATQMQFIDSAFREGRTLISTQTGLQSLGLGLRRAAISERRGELAGIMKRIPSLRSVRDAFRPTDRTIQPVRQQLQSQFRYKGFIRGVDSVTGTENFLNISFGDNELLTLGEIKNRFRSIANKAVAGGFLSGETYGEFDEFNVEVFSVEQRAL